MGVSQMWVDDRDGRAVFADRRSRPQA